ncbi:unnamed protein product [Effrenium voratum]|uniref:RNA-binding S4 domain-containing protein n=1 Tax=Effrenium voratum TaxID=2562239 RepID=A0AA36I7H7_9DINO|nr:unnamed protein product [Effrenium voratum]
MALSAPVPSLGSRGPILRLEGPVAHPSQPSRPSRTLTSSAGASVLGVLGLASRARSTRCKAQLAARRRRQSTDPLEHLTPRAEDIEPGERLFRQIYKPSMRKADFPEGEEEEQEEPSPRKTKRRGKAAWLAANQKEKEDPAYGKRWQLDPARRGPKNKPWAVGEVVDEVQDIDQRASKYRTMYKRPRFSWKEVEKDDLRTSALRGDMSAIGDDEVWLAKFLSHSGACSRRRVKELVLQGRITVNGEVIQDPVMKVDPKKDTVTLDGKVHKPRTLDELVWIMLYKPKDVLTTLQDPAGRKTIADLVPFAQSRRLVPVGRLERNSTGIVLLTNDYEWHTILAHPRYEMPKRYRVTVFNGAPNVQKLQALQRGLHLPDEARPCLPLEELEVVEHDRKMEMAALTFVMKEGKYRQILRMFEFLGHPIRAVKRTRIGLVGLDKELKAGQYRMLTPKEIRRLKGSTILKKPGGDPLARAKKMKKVFGGDSDFKDFKDSDFDELESESRPSRRGGRGARGAPSRRKARDAEPQEATLESLQGLALDSESEAEDGGDWEASWIQQLDEMTSKR